MNKQERKERNILMILGIILTLVCLFYSVFWVWNIDVMAVGNMPLYPSLPSWWWILSIITYFITSELLYFMMIIIYDDEKKSLQQIKWAAFGWGLFCIGASWAISFILREVWEAMILIGKNYIGISIIVGCCVIIYGAVKGIIWANIKVGEKIRKKFKK